jgi:hypothetical protein
MTNNIIKASALLAEPPHIRMPLKSKHSITPSMSQMYVHFHQLRQPQLAPPITSDSQRSLSYHSPTAIMMFGCYPYSIRCLEYLGSQRRSSRQRSLTSFVRTVMRLPSASWCVGASCVSRRRGKFGHRYRTLVLLVENFRDMLRKTYWVSEDVRR